MVAEAETPRYRIMIDSDALKKVLWQYGVTPIRHADGCTYPELRASQFEWFTHEVLARMQLTRELAATLSLRINSMWRGLAAMKEDYELPYIGQIELHFRDKTVSFWGYQIGALREVEDGTSFDPGDVSHEYPGG